MFDWLDKLREKSEKDRFKVAIFIAFFITFIIFLVWLSVMSLRFAAPVEENANPAEEELSPLSVFHKNISQVLNNGISSFKNIKDNLNSVDYEATDSNTSQ